MQLETKSLELLPEALALLDQVFNKLPSFEQELDLSAMRTVLLEVAERMQDNYPYPHPFYAGQMLKPPHPMARLAYMLALWINPNNHALDGGRASSAMEKEAVAQIAALFGWSEQHLGHLSSAGTTANMEALWVAGRLHPGKKIVASQQAHYTHARISEVLQLPFSSVATDQQARMDLAALEELLAEGNVGTVVATLGTTGVGAVDPLAEIIALKQKYSFRVHVDAAYGGYFGLANNLAPQTRAAYDAIQAADSIVVDPHKHGLQPYGCGSVLFRDPSVGAIYKHDSPYTYFSSDALHLGEISLECSRAGAAAVALWATQKLLPMTPDGEFAQGLSQGRAAALKLFELIRTADNQLTLFEPELDIVIWAPNRAKASEISTASQQVFDQAAEREVHLALIKLPAELLRQYWPHVDFDAPEITCVRSCLMKPEHLQWIEPIWERIKDLPHAETIA